MDSNRSQTILPSVTEFRTSESADFSFFWAFIICKSITEPSSKVSSISYDVITILPSFTGFWADRVWGLFQFQTFQCQLFFFIFVFSNRRAFPMGNGWTRFRSPPMRRRWLGESGAAVPSTANQKRATAIGRRRRPMRKSTETPTKKKQTPSRRHINSVQPSKIR